MKDFVLDMYRQMFANLNRGSNKGVYSNAKPVFLISILDFVTFAKDNKLKWGDKKLEELYRENYRKMDDSKMTQFWKPFYYMSSEPFYNLVWETEPDKIAKGHPSGKLLKNNLLYAQIDDELWTLLQDADNRAYLRSCIITTYFTR